MNDLKTLLKEAVMFEVLWPDAHWRGLAEKAISHIEEVESRADKAERDLGECLAATNEVLKDALEQGKEADVPNQALVKAVRAAYRLGAEEMREKAKQACRDRAFRAAEKKQQRQIEGEEVTWRAWFYDQTTSETLASIVSCIPLPGDAS